MNRRNNGLNDFIGNYNSFCKRFEGILAENNIRKDLNDNFYYIETPHGRMKYTWVNIKNAHDKDLLIGINRIRKEFVDGLIKIIEQTKEDFCTQKRNAFTYCTVQALGSDTLTSNYDVNVSSFIAASDIVHLFNTYFYLFWNDTSGEIFDTNLYGNSFFISTFSSDILDNKYNHFNSKDKYVYYLPPAGVDDSFMRSILAQQTRWLIIKSFLYADENRNVGNVGFIYDKVRGMSMRVIEKLVGGGNKIDRYRVEYDGMRMVNRGVPANEFRDEVNKKYYECLVVSDRLRRKYLGVGRLSIGGEVDNLSPLIDSISFSNFYGNETYFCIGTIYHVLGYVQGLGPFKMYREYYVQSMIENFLDVFRDLGYARDEVGFFKLTKYIYRVYDAIGRYYGLIGKNYSNNKKVMYANMLKSYKANKDKVRLGNYMDKMRGYYGVENENLIGIYRVILGDVEAVVNDYLVS